MPNQHTKSPKPTHDLIAHPKNSPRNTVVGVGWLDPETGEFTFKLNPYVTLNGNDDSIRLATRKRDGQAPLATEVEE